MHEKLQRPSPRFNAFAFSLTALRIWQWASSLFVYVSFGLLYNHIARNRLGDNGRLKNVQVLGLVSLVYSSLVIICVHVYKTFGQRSRWLVFAVMSVPGDLTVMGIYLAKITVLGLAGLPADCHGLTRDNYDDNDLVRQPNTGYSTIRFGPGTSENIGELDRLCTFPRSVYGLSVLSIFSYTFSILLTVLYLQQQRSAPVDSEKAEASTTGHIDGETVPDDMHMLSIDNASRPPSPDGSRSQDGSSLRSPSPPQGSIHHFRLGRLHLSQINAALTLENFRLASSRASSVRSSRSNNGSTWDATTLKSDTESTHSSDPYGISLPSSPSSSTPPTSGPSTVTPAPRRWSTSTTSSYNANAFIVTDGFRPEADPPAYTSRPGSLYQESMKYEAGLSWGR